MAYGVPPVITSTCRVRWPLAASEAEVDDLDLSRVLSSTLAALQVTVYDASLVRMGERARRPGRRSPARRSTGGVPRNSTSLSGSPRRTP